MLQKISYYLSLLSLLLFASSCSDSFFDGDEFGFSHRNLTPVSVRLKSPGSYVNGVLTETRTKARDFEYEAKKLDAASTTRTTSYDVSSISDVWALQYVDGMLTASSYVELNGSGDDVDFTIEVDTSEVSDIYFLVNTHDSLKVDKGGLASITQLKQLQDTINGETWCDSLGIPMYGVTKSVDFKKHNEEASAMLSSVSLKRLVARLDVTVYVKDGIEANSVQLCNTPGSFNYIEADTVKQTRYRTNFEAHAWSDDAAETVTYKGATYHKNKYTWYIPGYNPLYNTERTYVLVDVSGSAGTAQFMYRLYNETRSPIISANTAYDITNELSVVKAYGDSTTDAVVVCPSKVGWNYTTNSYDLANCYVVNTQNNTLHDFMFPIGQYDQYVQALVAAGKAGGTEEGIALSTISWYPQILWQTNTDNVDVKITGYTGKGDGTINLEVNPKNSDPSKCWSNVMIAMVNADGGGILWSWHLWICPKDVLSETFQLEGKTVLAYELGASRSILVSEDNSNTFPKNRTEWGESIGLYYQWGRKDPFRGAFGSATSYSQVYNHVASKTPITKYGTANTDYFYVKSTTSKANFEDRTTSILHPQALAIPNNTSVLWFGQGYDMKTIGNTSWGASKTVFDPSPPGYRVIMQSDLYGTSSYNKMCVDYGSSTKWMSESSTWPTSLTSASSILETNYPYCFYELLSKSGDYFYIPASGYYFCDITSPNLMGNICNMGVVDDEEYDHCGGFWLSKSGLNGDFDFGWCVGPKWSFDDYFYKGYAYPVIVVKE